MSPEWSRRRPVFRSVPSATTASAGKIFSEARLRRLEAGRAVGALALEMRGTVEQGRELDPRLAAIVGHFEQRVSVFLHDHPDAASALAIQQDQVGQALLVQAEMTAHLALPVLEVERGPSGRVGLEPAPLAPVDIEHVRTRGTVLMCAQAHAVQEAVAAELQTAGVLRVDPDEGPGLAVLPAQEQGGTVG